MVLSSPFFIICCPNPTFKCELCEFILFNSSEAETGGEVEGVVAVVEAVAGAGVPVALVVEVEGVKEVASGTYQRHAAVQVG